jgi:predicted porin
MLSRSGRTAILCAMAAWLGAPGDARADDALQWKLYGFLNAEVEQVGATGGATAYGNRWRVSDGNSRIGFNGSYALGERSRALWQLEASLASFEQGGTNDKGVTAILATRNTFVGVDDARLGRVLVGYNDSVYRNLVGSGGELGGNLGLTTLGLDLWNNTSAQVTGNPDSVFSRGEARYKNSIHYLSPDRMVRFGASYGLDEAVAAGKHRDRFSLGARVKGGGFQLGAGFDWQGNTGVNADQLQQGMGLRLDGEPGVATYYYKVVASWTAPSRTYLGAGWERSNYGYSQFVPPANGAAVGETVTGTMHTDALMVSIAQPFGKATVMASAAILGELKGAVAFAPADFKASQVSLGVKYDFNDHVASYAYGTLIKNAAQQNANLGQAPLYSNGAGTADAYLAPGNDPHAVGVGLIARF